MIVYLMAILKSIGDQMRKKIVRNFAVRKLMNVSKKLNHLKLPEF